MGKPYKPKDHFFRKAKQEGFRARSAFKMEEIARRFALVRRGDTVLDLGAAPGGFLQVLSREVGDKGRVLGVDIVSIRPMGLPNVQTFVHDVLADDFEEALRTFSAGPFDLVASDLAPKTTGIKDTDEARSHRLAEKALVLSRDFGRAGSTFVAKVFMGRNFEDFRGEVRKSFSEVKIVRPEATRGASMEVYVLGLKKTT